MEQRGLIEKQGDRGGMGITHVKLSDYSHEILDELYDKIIEFKNNTEAVLQEKLSIDSDVVVDKNHNQFFFNVDELPQRIKGELKADAELGYFRLMDSVVRQFEEGEDTMKVKTMPVFFNINDDFETSRYNPDYFKGGLTLLEGYIVGYSKLKDMEMGLVLRCPVNKKHDTIATKKAKTYNCTNCGDTTQMNVETKINMPVFELKVDLGNGDKLKAIVHAELWKPSLNQGNMQKLLLFKLSQESGFKVPTDVDYLVVGYDIKEEIKPDFEDAKYIADKSTKEIIDIFDYSLFNKIKGARKLKEIAVVTMGSINTQRLLVYDGGRYEPQRGILNTLFYGVPGSGKTKVARKMVELVNINIADAQAGNTSEAGWTAAFDNNEKIVRPGLIPMNNTRAVLVDELDKFTNGYSFLLAPLEDKKINWAKGGLQAEFNANTVIYMTANNIMPFGEQTNLKEQLKQEIDRKGRVNNPVISRTDLIHVIKEGVSTSTILTEMMKQNKGEIIPEERLKNYLLCIRDIEEVKVDPEALFALHEVTTEKNIDISNGGRILETWFRIAASIAKLHLRNTVIKEDIVEAMDIYEEMLQELGIRSIVELEEVSEEERIKEEILAIISKEEITEEVLQMNYKKDISDILKTLSGEQKITCVRRDDLMYWKLM